MDLRRTMNANGFLKVFLGMLTFVLFLSEIHLHAGLLSNPRGKVLIIVGISFSTYLRVLSQKVA